MCLVVRDWWEVGSGVVSTRSLDEARMQRRGGEMEYYEDIPSI